MLSGVCCSGAGENMNASQFYITTGEDLDSLDGKHTIFGEVAEGLDVLMAINDAFADAGGRPLQNIRQGPSVSVMAVLHLPPACCNMSQACMHLHSTPRANSLEACGMSATLTSAGGLCRIRHTIILDDPFPDMPQLAELIPDASPELVRQEVSSRPFSCLACESDAAVPTACLERVPGRACCARHVFGCQVSHRSWWSWRQGDRLEDDWNPDADTRPLEQIEEENRWSGVLPWGMLRPWDACELQMHPTCCTAVCQ